MRTTGNPSQPICPSTYGPAYDHEKDGARLTGQLKDIADLMEQANAQDAWLTLSEIEQRTGYPQSSISAQLRHLRKREFGSHSVLKRRRENREGATRGTWEYRVCRRCG
jgi:hypothetical protein